MGRCLRAAAGALMAMMAAVQAAGPVVAQTAPNARKGLETARAICAGCHAVERGNLRSINPAAPAFSAIAGWPGVSDLALRAGLQSSHLRMPDIVLARDDREDIIAYILGLRDD